MEGKLVNLDRPNQAALKTTAVIAILDTSNLAYAYEAASRNARKEVVVAESRATYVA